MPLDELMRQAWEGDVPWSTEEFSPVPARRPVRDRRKQARARKAVKRCR